MLFIFSCRFKFPLGFFLWDLSFPESPTHFPVDVVATNSVLWFFKEIILSLGVVAALGGTNCVQPACRQKAIRYN